MKVFLTIVGAIIVAYIIIQKWRQHRLRKLENHVLDGTSQLRDLKKARDALDKMDSGE